MKELVEKFKELNLEYLHFSGYINAEDDDEYREETPFHRDEEHDLYFDMFNAFIQPIIDEVEASGYATDRIIFDSFSLFKETKEVYGVFYEPQMCVQLEKEHYDEEIKEAVELSIAQADEAV